MMLPKSFVGIEAGREAEPSADVNDITLTTTEKGRE